ncbi:MAG: endonuclease/exonuclease/phosphatase family protein [Verrucomicrobia bacterium]|nr:endonuclease/exonuclease/phosphatase family protein [Verrucomicrobiota bacterium]
MNITGLSATASLMLSSLAAPIVSDAVVAPQPAIVQQDNSNFIYLKGNGAEKLNFNNNSVLTLNLDMLKGRLAALYGGVTAPVDVRSERVKDLLAEEGFPDIFVAQEVPLESAYKLYEPLKNEYPHFYVGMGIEPGKKESGLFVASKYPIQEHNFVPFPEEMMRTDYEFPEDIQAQYPVRILYRGFFYVKTSPKTWIVTTHLEPGNRAKGAEFRKAQLAYIAQEMDKIVPPDESYVLLGDINIERTEVHTAESQDEYSLSGIRELFDDPYTDAHPAFDESTYTCTNILDAITNGRPIPESATGRNEIDDYVLFRKGRPPLQNVDIQLKTNTYDVTKDPSFAITDHRAYVLRYTHD